MGLLATGTSCLALVWVMGRSLVPAPPARMSAFSMSLRPLGELGVSAPGVGAVALGHDGLGHPPVDPELGVVPRHAELVLGVVVAIDQIGHGDVGQGGEAVGNAARDVDAGPL